MNPKKRFALKARFFRFIHLIIRIFLFPHETHQAFTISRSLTLHDITIFLLETNYVACTCGKVWHRSELNEDEKALCRKLIDSLI
jgi:hypothetical protein